MIIDGKMFAQQLRAELAEQIQQLKQQNQLEPGLAVVLVGEDPASQVYVRNKRKQAVEVGIQSFEYTLPAQTSQVDLLNLIDQLNHNPAIHGILVQLPLPDHIDTQQVLLRIKPEKDVDGFHPTNVGALATGSPSLIPCTPLGCLLLLKAFVGDLTGLHAVVVGRSNIVGKPMAQLLLAEDCTVTMAHSKTKQLPDLCRSADILIAAVGRPQFIDGSWIKAGAAVIDVGINRTPEGRLVGDVMFQTAHEHAGFITPVPGGVGPMTIACLLRNTLTAACHQARIADPNQ